MPIYEYECQDCGTVFEVIQKFSDPELTDCRSCDNERPVKKLISAAAFHLKGTGWYVTDFRDKRRFRRVGDGRWLQDFWMGKGYEEKGQESL